MFNDTLLNNMSLYDNYEQEDISEKIEMLHLNRIKDIIFSNEEYVDSENNISGGEKQKINLARVLLQNKPYLFLDEVAAYDLESYKAVLQALLKNEQLTIINIEHKVPKEMLDLYDEVIVLKYGEIEEIYRTEQEKLEFAKELN